jgi:hypothetical protein
MNSVPITSKNSASVLKFCRPRVSWNYFHPHSSEWWEFASDVGGGALHGGGGGAPHGGGGGALHGGGGGALHGGGGGADGENPKTWRNLESRERTSGRSLLSSLSVS